MKHLLKIAFVFLVAFSTTSAASAEKQIAGPNGGKLLENESPRAEFLVGSDHHITIRFYDENLKQVPAGDQNVTATAESDGKKTKLEFDKKGDMLVSKTALPHGEGYNIVVQLKQDPAAKTQNFRIKYDTHVCGGCKLPEYACTCDE